MTTASAGWPDGAEPLSFDPDLVVRAIALADAATRRLTAGDVPGAVTLRLEALGQLGQRLDDLLEAPNQPGVLDGTAVASITGDLLDAVLGRPSTLLAAYGALRPGEVLHHVVEPLGGTWHPVTLRGDLAEVDGWLVLHPHAAGPAVPAMALRADALATAWTDLDQVEGSAYRRAVVPAWTTGGVLAATCYVLDDR